MALRRVQFLWSVSIVPRFFGRRGVSGQVMEKFKKAYGSPEGISIDNLLQVIELIRILKMIITLFS